MTSRRREEIEALLVDRALVGLSEEQAAELARHVAEEGVPDDPSFDVAAAAVALAELDAIEGSRAEEPIPASLAARIESAARGPLAAAAKARSRAVVDEAPPYGRDVRSTTAAGAQVVLMPVAQPKERGADWTRWGGWFAAAAAACVLVGQRAAPPAAVTAAPPSKPADARSIPIDAPVQGALGGEVRARGALSWSETAGRGDLVVRGLPVGDYELWIDDASRADRQPLAAGAFHSAVDGEVVAAVAPAIAPHDATLLRVVGSASAGGKAPGFTVPLRPR